MRLATFNILHGRSLTDDRVDVDRYAAAVTSLGADVLALQEVDRQQPRSHHADLTAVAAEAMGAVAHRFVAAIAGTPGATWMAATGQEQPGTAEYGIALLSRYPVRSWQVVRLPAIPFTFPMWLPGPRKVITVHEEPRAAVIAVVETPDGELTVVNTHLSFVPGWNRLQLRRLRRDLAGAGVTAERAQLEVLWIGRDGEVSGGAAAVAQALRAAGRPWSLAGVLLDAPPLRWVAPFVYRLVAANRYRLPGGTAACRVPPG